MGGGPVTIAQHPYQVSMEKLKSHDCGGSILSDTWVLTAAHCLFFRNAAYKPHYITIRYGSSTKERGGAVLQAVWTGLHTEYNSAYYAHDIGLIQVETPFVFSSAARPVQLPAVGWAPGPGDVYTVTGWGTEDSEDIDGPEQLHAVQVPAVPHNTSSSRAGEFS